MKKILILLVIIASTSCSVYRVNYDSLPDEDKAKLQQRSTNSHVFISGGLYQNPFYYNDFGYNGFYNRNYYNNRQLYGNFNRNYIARPRVVTRRKTQVRRPVRSTSTRVRSRKN